MSRTIAAVRDRLFAGVGTAEDVDWARQRLRALEDMGAEIGVSDAEAGEIAALAALLARFEAGVIAAVQGAPDA